VQLVVQLAYGRPWRLVLLVDEAEVSGENHRPVPITDKRYHSIFRRVPLVISVVPTHNIVITLYEGKAKKRLKITRV